MSKYFLLIVATVLLNTTSQILMKTGMNQVGTIDFSFNGMGRLAQGFVTNVFVIVGLTTMIISMVTHLMSLSQFDVSFAFPFISLAYVVVLIYGYFVLGENINASRVAGIGFIIFGTVLIARS